jgi:tetratricopeptide (TPR) repeat protein
LRAILLVLLGCLLAAAADAEPPRDDARAVERRVRRSLEDARALVREGRLEHAEIALRRGLDADPDHARLHRTLAEVLAAQGRSDAAARERSLADALDPPAAAPPDVPLELPTGGLVVVMLPPEAQAGHPERVSGGWPERRELRALEARVRVRLRGARIVRADLESVAEARAWLVQRAPSRVLSLRIERAWCGESIKDGRFAVGAVRAAAAAPGMPRAGEALGREVVFDPGPACEAEALARALERALAAPEIAAALRAPVLASGPAASATIRALFPGIGRRIDAELRRGERLLAEGRISEAATCFRNAAEIDPEDETTRAYLHEAEATMALARELARRAGEPPEEIHLDPRMTQAQLAAAEARLREEEHLRAELLAALAVLDEELRPPAAKRLAALHPVEIPDPSAPGPSLARRRAGGEVEARVARAPDGGLLARYFFPIGEDRPVLREDDTNGDREPDRWIVYEGDARSEVYEAGAADRPALRLVFAAAGRRLARVEIDQDSDGHPERILHYRDARVSGEARDTNGDGRFDTFDRLDAAGRVAIREEDIDGDGSIDVRSSYEAGRLVRRELSRPEPIPGS